MRRSLPGCGARDHLIMGPDAWVALAALIVTCLMLLAGIAYRQGAIAADLKELRRRMEVIESKLDHRKPARLSWMVLLVVIPVAP